MLGLDQKESRELTKFGLTLTQANIYYILVSLREANAKTITNLSKIARQDVYRVLDELFEKGLIEKKIANPTEYRALPIDQCLSLLLNIRNRKTLELQELAKELKKMHSTLKQESEQPCKLTLVPSGEQILFKSYELLNSAQKTIAIISPAKSVFPWIIDQHEQFHKSLKRKVKIQLVTNSLTNQKFLKQINDFLNNKPNFEIKYLDSAPSVSYGIYDNKKVILELSATNAYTKSDVIITDNPCFIELTRNYFDTIWSTH
jgi:sugar-specific transcriptional regulator TrmB